MARNKHPEETVNKILDAAQRLFAEKGYEKTTIQDIVDALDGLTKGAVYHHFKSKDEIIDALGTRIYTENNPLEKVAGREDLNGLEKLQMALRLQQQDTTSTDINAAALPLLKNPRYLAQQLEDMQQVVAPQLRPMIEEGIGDGSIAPHNPVLLSELTLILLNLWTIPSVFPSAGSTPAEKLALIQEILGSLGMPILQEDVLRSAEDTLNKMEDHKQ